MQIIGTPRAAAETEETMSAEEFGRLVDENAAHNRRLLRTMTPQGRRAFATYMRTGALPPTAARPPRSAPRPRGARRRATRCSAMRSSAASGDSGDDDPEPAPARRLLASWAEVEARAAERAAILLRLAAVEPRQLRLGERRRP